MCVEVIELQVDGVDFEEWYVEQHIGIRARIAFVL
jgi:hypothetical protein